MCLFKNEVILKLQQKSESEGHILKKPIRLLQVLMMIKDYKLLIELEHILTEQMLLKYIKLRW